VTTGDDKQVLVWDVPTGDLKETYDGHAGRVFGPAFSPDGKTAYTVGLDGAMIAWDLGGARRLGRPFIAGSGDQGPPNIGIGFSRLAISPDGTRVASVENSGRASVVDLTTGRQLFETANAGRELEIHGLLDVAW